MYHHFNGVIVSRFINLFMSIFLYLNNIFDSNTIQSNKSFFIRYNLFFGLFAMEISLDHYFKREHAIPSGHVYIKKQSYSIHHYVIKFVCEFQQESGFLLGNPVFSINKTDRQ